MLLMRAIVFLLTGLLLAGCMQSGPLALSDANFTARDKQQLTNPPYRNHGTNQPEYIGHAISSGCIRMTNEGVIDLYSRVKMGATVVVLGPSEQRVVSAR